MSRHVAYRSDKDSTSPTFRARRIIGLFPELLGVGGVQEAGRQTTAALDEIARRHGWETVYLSLNDASGEQLLSHGAMRIPFRGFGRAKVQFFLAAAKVARDNASVCPGGSSKFSPARCVHENAIAAAKNHRDLTWYRSVAAPTASSASRATSSGPSTRSQSSHHAKAQ